MSQENGHLTDTGLECNGWYSKPGGILLDLNYDEVYTTCILCKLFASNYAIDDHCFSPEPFGRKRGPNPGCNGRLVVVSLGL